MAPSTGTEPGAPPGRATLKQAVSRWQFFTLAFGTIVGVGWVIYLGHWLAPAGPLGAAIGFFAGTLLVALIALCYAEMAAMFPVSGGELAYVFEALGTGASFITGWTLAFVYTAVTTWEGIAIGVLAEHLFPGLGGPVLYTLFDTPVRLGTMVLGLAFMAFFVGMNVRGVGHAARLQDVLTYTFLGLGLVFIGAGLVFGHSTNLEPLVVRAADGSVMPGLVAAFITAPFFLAGFDVVPQLMEEKSAGTSGRSAAVMMVVAVCGAGLFYVLVIVSASMVVPWRHVVELEALPAAAAFREAFSSPLFSRVILLAAFIGILTTWNAVMIGASRVLFAMSRACMVPPFLGRVHPDAGSPAGALVFVGLLGAVGVVLGRGAIAPLVNMGTICFGIAFALVALSVVRLRVTRPRAERPFRVPGGIVTAGAALAGALLFIGLSLKAPYQPGRGLPVEWVLLLVCLGLGGGFWLAAARFRKSISDAQRRQLILGDPREEG